MEINDQKLTAAEILALAMPKKRARAKRPTTRPATALRNVRNTENMPTETEEQKKRTGPLAAPSCSAWTEKPPEKEGWYWIRFAGVEARPVEVNHNGTTMEYYIPGMGKFSLFYPPSHFVEFAACEPPNAADQQQAGGRTP